MNVGMESGVGIELQLRWVRLRLEEGPPVSWLSKRDMSQ